MKIDYNIKENRIYISYDNIINVNVYIYEWDPIINLTTLLYETNAQFNYNTVWFATGRELYNLKGIKIEIKKDFDIIKEEFFDFNNKNDINNKYLKYLDKQIDKNVSIYVKKQLGLGDFMWVTPFIRKLSNIYNKKIDVYGYPMYEEFLKNNPYVNNFYNNSLYSIEEINNINENFDVFYDFGVPYLYSDLKQLAAKSAGLTLKESELELDYIPDEYIEIPELPEDYILINPRIDHIERRLNDNDWQLLIDLLNEKNIPVVAIGVGPSKHCTNLNIKNGVNLIYDERQNSLSQTWHIINKSKVFLTFDTGIYVLAGTTDTNILLNGWNCDPWFHQPFRNGSKNYKFSTVRGYCPFYCSTDPITNVIELDSSKLLHKTNKCVLNTNYNCIPKPHTIVDKLIELKWI